MEPKDQTPHINVDYFEDLTGDIAKSGKKEGEEAIGTRIRRLREEKGLSLKDLSEMTGFDTDLIDRIESNQVQPQLGTVMKLSRALDSALGRVLSGVGDRLYSITRKSERKEISRSTGKQGQQQLYTYMSLAPEVKGRHMEALIVQLEENPEEEPSVHDGEEFIFVLDGTVTLKIGEDRFDLEPGDSVYYLSTTPHVIAARQNKATILAVLYEG
jgi:transcriptional regulator with XRE-family HTH domain